LKPAPADDSWQETNTAQRCAAAGRISPFTLTISAVATEVEVVVRRRGDRDATIVDDIPVARRSQPQSFRRPSRGQRFGWFLLGCLLVAAGSAALVLGPLRPLISPPPVAGLNARLSADGRLLGHFPYPEAPGSRLVALAPGLQLRSEAASALMAMQREAAAEGIDLVVLSGFRSISLQKQLFFDVKAERNQSASSRARVSAPPGFSEHSTGYAVDLGDGRLPGSNLSQSFAATPAFAWLQRHAARHHFLLSFPAGNRQGVSYEPWHWRYEGSTDALRLFEPAQRLAAKTPGAGSPSR